MRDGGEVVGEEEDDEEEAEKWVSRHLAAQLEEAAEVGRRAAEEAKTRTDYELLEDE